jgi:hypothetical protein
MYRASAKTEVQLRALLEAKDRSLFFASASMNSRVLRRTKIEFPEIQDTIVGTRLFWDIESANAACNGNENAVAFVVPPSIDSLVINFGSAMNEDIIAYDGEIHRKCFTPYTIEQQCDITGCFFYDASGYRQRFKDCFHKHGIKNFTRVY